MAYKVAAALVAVKNTDGALSYFYQGADVPDSFDTDDLARLSEAGLIVDAEAVSGDGEPSDSWTVKQLKAFADTEGIDLGEAKSKADILSKLNE